MKDQQQPPVIEAQHDPDRLRAPTVDADGHRRWIYPDRRPGPNASTRKKLAIGLIIFYLLAPYIKVNGLPLLRLDVLAQKAYFAGTVFNFHEANFLVFVFLILALALFLITSIFGRVWCGYACPQTVFVEWLIRPVEEFFEGKAHHRRVVDRGPWTWSKFWRKTGKYLTFIVIVLAISNAFLAYFVPPSTLLEWVTQAPSHHPVAFGVMSFISIALFFDLVWFREQFCSFLCPYARFQALMFDENTPTVTYDSRRGEKRGRGKNAGDCIDCGHCVRVCPTGIDIRDGLQLECIQCMRCVDACDQVMTNIKRPKGLIRVSSEAAMSGKQKEGMRWRPLIYAAGLILVLVIFVSTVWLRPSLEITLIRQSGTTFIRTADDRIANYFRVRVNNRLSQAQVLSLQTPEGVSLMCSVCDRELEALNEENGSIVIMVPLDWQDSHIELGFTDESGRSLSIPLILPGSR
ncbi:MAG: cytochrome c oxidase accessory protein CcoG [Oligoflexus sp.]